MAAKCPSTVGVPSNIEAQEQLSEGFQQKYVLKHEGQGPDNEISDAGTLRLRPWDVGLSEPNNMCLFLDATAVHVGFIRTYQTHNELWGHHIEQLRFGVVLSATM